ncbi:hypothetical protein DUI87_20658 [Hirundo rustica rustica]|uniref:Uncharacterized protein n=1 Tax=Hirundo rustica rustica TaxID=333673 RepID=A0A3M0JRK3_HIRRU|nr:hypothetical protein DUI87_20658 [Hirundo rustica rustica]
MERARYKAHSQACQVNTPHQAIVPGLGRRWRENQAQHNPPGCALLLAAGTAGQRKKAQRSEDRDKRPRQGQQVQARDMLIVLLCSNRAGRGQQQKWKHRGRRHVNGDNQRGQQKREKDLMEQDPRASSSNGCERHGGQRSSPVHGPQQKRPGKAQWQGHDCSRNWEQQPLQRTKPLHQDQAGEQSGSDQKRELLWNAKKRSWITVSHLPATIWQEARTRLRPMNLAGYRLPGMCTPHNTNQFFMGHREYMRIDENEVAVEIPGEDSDCSTEDEDLPLMATSPSTDQ